MKQRPIEADEGSEMEVDNEEKVDIRDSEVEEEEDDEDPSRSNPVMLQPNPFLDSFYGLSSQDAKERSESAQTILHHCFLGPDANSKDSAYALKRLLNGICSGRAAARQGNASALASFLKAAFRLEKMTSLRNEVDESTSSTSSSNLSFVRERLIAATDPTQGGKKKGSEDRDYQFGRLFGILAISRSGILMPGGDNQIEEVKAVTSVLVADLVDLFWMKKWMREPAAHGIVTLLASFFGAKKERKSSLAVAQSVIRDVVIPKLLSKGSDGVARRSFQDLLGSVCAEQVGVAIMVQSYCTNDDVEWLSFPLDKPIISLDTLPLLADALGDTSRVVQPRTHFVWDALWQYLTRVDDSTDGAAKGAVRRVPRKKCLIGPDSAVDVLEAIVSLIVKGKLLGICTTKDASNSCGSKTTHDRKSLAIRMVQVLAGVPYESSLSGPSQIILGCSTLQDVILEESLLRTLFLDVICAGNHKKQTSHLLKPLALTALEEITTVVQEEGSFDRQMTCVKAFLKCDVRFDARTKTTTVSRLLGFTDPAEKDIAEFCTFGQDFVSYLEDELFRLAMVEDTENTANITGYVELLYGAAKSALRVEPPSDSTRDVIQDFQSTVVRRVLHLFMVSAFFNCRELQETKATKKKASNQTCVLNAGLKMKKLATQQNRQKMSHAVRAVMAARFFSLVSDFVHQSSHSSNELATDTKKAEKEATSLSILVAVCDSWEMLEKYGASRFSVASSDHETDEVPKKVLHSISKELKSLDDGENSDSTEVLGKRRCVAGIAVLVYTLHLHRLSCSSDDSTDEEEDIDMDEDGDEDEICRTMGELQLHMDDFLQGEMDPESNPLLGLAETCSNLLSSPLGSGDLGRGCSPKLVRESIKYAWLGGLRLSSFFATPERSLLDKSVVGVLLEAIGAPTEDEEAEADEDEDGSDESEEGSTDDSSENSQETGFDFSKVGSVLNDDAVDENDRGSDDEVLLDQSNLQSILAEDSDMDIDENVLEHHEGADGALAKLLKLKQESRKAGQQIKEKIEIGHQLRCTFLIELLFGRPDAWGRLFRTHTIAKMVLPILVHKRTVERSLSKSVDAGTKVGLGEKRGLLERLTSLLKTKMLKMRFGTLPMPGDVPLDFVARACAEVVNSAKASGSSDNGSCLSQALVFFLRLLPSDTETNLEIQETCLEAVREWSTRRSSGLSSTFFQSMISMAPHLAQIYLSKPICEAAVAARSPFLKVESYNLLALLFSQKPNPDQANVPEQADSTISSIQSDFISALGTTLVDDEMKKVKRLRTVLKASEKFLSSLPDVVDDEILEKLESVRLVIQDMGAVDSNVATAVSKVSSELTNKIGQLKGASSKKRVNVGESSQAKKPKKKKKKKRK